MVKIFRIKYAGFLLWAFATLTIQSQNVTDHGISAADKIKIDALLKTMTLEEKIGQLSLFSSDWDATGPSLNDNYKKMIKEGKAGSIFNAYTVDYLSLIHI